MSARRLRIKGIVGLSAMVLLTVHPGTSQKVGSILTPQAGSQQQPANPNPLGPDLPPGLQEKQAKAQNDERQKRLVADTDKLLQLATELHADVEKTDKNTLSLDVLKRADEIEKLAHSVKVRMRG